VHLGNDLELVLNCRDLLGRSGLGPAEAEHFDGLCVLEIDFA